MARKTTPKVRSTVPERGSAAGRKSFSKAAARQLKYLFNDAADGKGEVAEKVRLWNKFIPVSPRMAAEILGRDLPPETVIKLSLKEDGSGRVDIDLDGKFGSGRDFELKKKLLESGLTEVQPDYQARGTGRILFRNQVEFFLACGARKFEITAALDNGGYTWARVGFLPDDLSAEEHSLIGKAQKSFDVLRPLLTKGEARSLERALEFKKRKDLWTVADSKIDLGPRLKKLFNQAAGNHGVSPAKKEKAQELAESLRAHFNDGVIAYMEKGAAAGTPVALGRVLLTGTSWSGTLDLTNPVQMARMGNYIGGWKFIEIK